MDSRQFTTDLLSRSLDDAERLLKKHAFGDALLKVTEVMVVADERYLSQVSTRARSLQRDILKGINQFKGAADKFRELQAEIEAYLIAGNNDKVAEKCQHLLQIAPDLDKQGMAKKYEVLLAQAREKKARPELLPEQAREPNLTGLPEPDASKLDGKILQLRRLEETFQNEFLDGHFAGCVDILSLVRQQSEAVGDILRVELYQHLQQLLKDHLSDPRRIALLNPQMAEAIETAKAKALQLEEALKFEEARKVYEEVKILASRMQDQLMVALCEQRIAQLVIWEEEIARSDFSKWDIPPFKLLSRTRYDCLEVLPDPAAADARRRSLISQRVNPKDIQVVTIVRTRFRGQAPFNSRGECWGIYIRRMWDF